MDAVDHCQRRDVHQLLQIAAADSSAPGEADEGSRNGRKRRPRYHGRRLREGREAYARDHGHGQKTLIAAVPRWHHRPMAVGLSSIAAFTDAFVASVRSRSSLPPPRQESLLLALR